MSLYKINLHCDSETGVLRDVIIGTYQKYNASGSLQPMCQHMQETWENGRIPSEDTLKPEYDEFTNLLRTNGVNVRLPIAGYADEQLFTRDIGFVIGDEFVEARMKDLQRKKELDAIHEIKSRFAKIITPPDDILVEGGDIIIDKGQRMYVGVGQRTNWKGYEFLRDKYSRLYTVIPVNTTISYGTDSECENDDVLHLDCTFMPVGQQHALIYRPGLNSLPKEFEDYKLIDLTHDEHKGLGTNILSISPDTVIARRSANRVNDILRGIGIKVLEIDFDVAPTTGGSVRCSALPLYRDKI